jgi:hypothetical protein
MPETDPQGSTSTLWPRGMSSFERSPTRTPGLRAQHGLSFSLESAVQGIEDQAVTAIRNP